MGPAHRRVDAQSSKNERMGVFSKNCIVVGIQTVSGDIPVASPCFWARHFKSVSHQLPGPDERPPPKPPRPV
jgi:hypothetical protein